MLYAIRVAFVIFYHKNRWKKLRPIARGHELSNAYVFVTRNASPGIRDYAGWGYVGQVCGRDKGYRISLNRNNKRVLSFALV